MATDEASRKITLIASIATARYLGIVIDSSGEAVLAGAGVPIVGVSTEDGIIAADAMPVQLADGGKAICEAGAAVAAGADLMMNASAQFITATTGNAVVGTALQAASGAAVAFEAVVLNQGYLP